MHPTKSVVHVSGFTPRLLKSEKAFVWIGLVLNET